MAFDIKDYLSKNKIKTGTVERADASGVYKGGNNDLRKTQYDVLLTEDGKLDMTTQKKVTINSDPITEGYDSLTGLIYVDNVPFTKESIQKVVDFFKKTKSPKLPKQFKSEPVLRVEDSTNHGIVFIYKETADMLDKMTKKHKVASDSDF